MGVGVSSWPLARAVSLAGQLGVVSGTALDIVLARRLQMGDPDGRLRQALVRFPDRDSANVILESYFVEGGKARGAAFRPTPMHVAEPAQARDVLGVAAGFVEVLLAKEGHAGLVGINFLEKIQLPTPAILYGAMLAGVDYVLMGAGIPREIPGVIDRLATHASVSPRLHVAGATADDDFRIDFDPGRLRVRSRDPLKRPRFLPIIASAALALTLARKANGRVDGFVIEGPTAGGHNAPPRGDGQRSARGEPVYGPRDEVDLEKIKSLGLPFWLAGLYGTAERVREALERGAAGVQVGTAFALCRESSIDPAIKARLLDLIAGGRADVFTDPLASPSGYPFKVAQLDGSLSERPVVATRQRCCDVGCLREPYKLPDGALGYRCPAEPVATYRAKGGDAAATEGRLCLCNGLLATIGLGQVRGGRGEPPIVTAGEDLRELGRFIRRGRAYSAADVIESLLLVRQLAVDMPLVAIQAAAR
jgi:nitronate monooxygenase